MLQALAKLSEVKGLTTRLPGRPPPRRACGNGMKRRMCLYMEIDVGRRKARLSKEIARIEGEMGKANGQALQAGLRRQGPAAVLDRRKSAAPTSVPPSADSRSCTRAGSPRLG